MINKPDLGKCNLFLDSGFSLVSVGNNKIPNFPWKKLQTEAISKSEFEKQYHYAGDIVKKNGENIPATSGIGIITGFNGLEVFDIDLKIFKTLKEQQDFWAEYTGFLKDNIADFDDKFVIYRTVNGGYHILYRCAKLAGNTKIAVLKGHTEAVIETRGIGGYVFIYDKQISKKSYFEIEEISELDRDVLFSVSKYYDYVDETAELKTDKKPVEVPAELTVWDDYNAKTQIFDVLETDFTIIKNLSDKYIIRRHGATTPHSGYVYKNSGCMYLFSTGSIFPHEKLISPFSAYAIKYHNSDYSVAAKDLYAKGFGSRIVKKVKQLEVIPDEILYQNIKFPLEIFPVEIQNYILECHRTLDSSVDYMGCSFMWLLSVIIGNSVKIQVKPGWIEPGTLWMTIVGKAGIGKTPSISNVVFPLQRENNREIRKFVKNFDKYAEYCLLDKEEKKNTEKLKKPKKTQFIADDITLEALVDMHEENKNAIGVFKDELAGWIKDMNKYRAGSDLEFWLSTWSAKSVSLNRKTAKSAFVSNPLIPVLGGIQPGIFDTFYTEQNKDNGFIDRMLLCFPDLQVEKYNDNELNANVIQWYSDYTIAFYQEVRNRVVKFDSDDEIEPFVAEMDSEARVEWKRIFNSITGQQNDEDINEYMKSMLPKQKSYIPRFALLINCLSVFDRSGNIAEFQNINKKSILAAEKLSQYFVEMAKKIKISTNEIQDIKRLLNNKLEQSPFERFQTVYKVNPKVNKVEIAEKLGVSRNMIYKYIEKINLESVNQ